MADVITDFETWLLDHGDRLYRYLVYKRIFTPYEQQNAFVDESAYEDSHYNLCKIEEAIDLGLGEWLLGLRTVGEDGKLYGMIHYYKLSEIRLALFENDQCVELYEKEEERKSATER
jgi:hypothetical protein